MTTGFTPLGSEFLVNTETNSTQSYPSITSLADGGFVVTWQSYDQDGSYWGTYWWGIYGQRYDASGATVGVEFLINTETIGSQSAPSITSFVDGGFVVTWHSFGQDGSGDGAGVYGQRYDASGSTLGPEFQINTYTSNDQTYPSITSLVDGGFVVTWQSKGQDGGGGHGIYGQRYDVQGLTVGSEFLINTEVADGQISPEITSLNDGGFIVVWASDNQDSSLFGIFGQRYDAQGLTVGSEFLINTEVNKDQDTPSITSLADGGFVVAWTSKGQDSSFTGVYAQRYAASGLRVGDEFLVNTEEDSLQQVPSITSLADGGFVVTWASSYQDGSNSGIFGQRYDAGGGSVGSEFQINTYTNLNQYAPSITSLTDGGFVVTWISDGQDGSEYGIYAQQFEAQLFGTSDDDIIIDTVGANWMHGQDGNDTLNGGSGRDKVFGGAGKDALSGGGARDKLYGGNGADILFGNSANDKLYGGNGADHMDGGKGKDILTGGAGADVFVFADASDSANSNKADVITDFEVGVDHIDLSAIGALTYIGNVGFSGAVGELRVGSNGTDSFVRVDVDGDGASDMKIMLEGVTGITVGDFIL